MNTRVVTATMDHRARLAGVYDLTGDIGVAWTYDEGDRRTDASLSNLAQSAFDYDLNNRVTGIWHAEEAPAVVDPFYHVEYGYDHVGNPLYKRDHVRAAYSEAYQYDNLYRLTDFGRGTLTVDQQDAVVLNQDGWATIDVGLVDADIPSRQTWKTPGGDSGLDARGNWLGVEIETAGVTAVETRTVDDSAGGAANEYDRIEYAVGGGTGLQQLAYDEAGNLIAMFLVGDMNCDGAVDFSDIDAFILSLLAPPPAPRPPEPRIQAAHASEAVARWLCSTGLCSFSEQSSQKERAHGIICGQSADRGPITE